MLLEWSDDYLIGIDNIDKQHKELHSKIGKLHQDILESNNKNDFQDALDSLGKYATSHFKSEEALMRRYNYPNIEEHLKLHTEFLNEYSKLLNKYSKTDSSQILADQITEIVQKEVINHITQADMVFGRFVNSRT